MGREDREEEKAAEAGPFPQPGQIPAFQPRPPQARRPARSQGFLQGQVLKEMQARKEFNEALFMEEGAVKAGAVARFIEKWGKDASRIPTIKGYIQALGGGVN